jgi:predicted DsbA family dithiol-disulfide isomerase
LRLAEVAKASGEAVFYRLHTAIFAAFFVARENIAQPDVLRRLAMEAGMPQADIERALDGDAGLEAQLARHLHSARKLAIGGVPAFVIGDQLLNGCVPLSVLEAAAAQAVGQS